MKNSSADWANFYSRYRAAAVRFARGLVGQDDLAEDLVQEALGEVLRRVAEGRVEFESEEHCRNYFFRTVHHRAAEHLRSPERRRRVELMGEPVASGADADPLQQVLREEASGRRAEVSRQLREAIAGLRTDERELLQRRYRDGRRLREISETTGLSISTLHSRLQATLRSLRKRLGKVDLEA